MEREEVEIQKRRADAHAIWLKIVLWTLTVAICGAILCLVLGAVRWALEAFLIVAGVLVIIALIGMLIYEKMKYRIKEDQYNRQQKRLARDNSKIEN